MPTGPGVVVQASEKTEGNPLVTIDGLARKLKQHNPPMFARSIQGGGNASPQASCGDICRLFIAMSVADPITTAPKRVAGYAALTVEGVRVHQRGTIYLTKEEAEGAATRLLFPKIEAGPDGDLFGRGLFGSADSSFGQFIENLTDLVAKDAEAAKILTVAYLMVEFVMDASLPSITVAFRAASTKKGTTDAWKRLIFYPASSAQTFPRREDPASNFLSASTTAKPKILRKVEWDMPLICVMAKIWADSLAHLSKTATPPTSAAAPASANSEARDGTDAPAREPAPPRAVPNRPTRKVARQQSQQLERSARTFRGQPVGNFIESPDHV